MVINTAYFTYASSPVPPQCAANGAVIDFKEPPDTLKCTVGGCGQSAALSLQFISFQKLQPQVVRENTAPETELESSATA